MDEFKEKQLRPGRIITDQFLIASALSFLIVAFSAMFIPLGKLALGFFESVLGGDHDAAEFLRNYFDFISIWVGLFVVVILFKGNRPMLKAVKYESPRVRGGDGLTGNRAGNNFIGFLIGLALGFGCNGFCILMSVLMGDIYLEYSGFKLLPFLLFFLCVFIQSAAEELADRWYLYQKPREENTGLPGLTVSFNGCRKERAIDIEARLRNFSLRFHA